MGVALKLCFLVSLFNTILAYLLILQDFAVCLPAHRSFISRLLCVCLFVCLSQAVCLTNVDMHQLRGTYSNCKISCSLTCYYELN